MKLRNPSHKTAAKLFIESKQAAIQTYFDNNSSFEYIDFDKVRADNPGIADQLTDGVIAQICQNLGIAIEA